MQDVNPLDGVVVLEHASGAAAAYAGRLLTSMGAETIMLEPPSLCDLRWEPPFLDRDDADRAGDDSALFTYLAAGKKSVICDLAEAGDRAAFDALAARADILIDDTPLASRERLGLDAPSIALRHPHLVHVSALPYGAEGPKAGWRGEEVNLIHAGGEGFLLPNGLSADLFPDRPPLKIAGRFAEMQGGVVAALAALSALWAGGGQFVDCATQDANVAVGAFAIQRFGDGSLEHRLTRSFRFGGVIECRDGFVELLTLEDRQWKGLIELMGSPDWAADPALDDPVERSAQGAMINEQIRAWARLYDVDDLVARAQKLGVPMARYNEPGRILAGAHETARGIFQEVETVTAGPAKVQSAPFRFGPSAPRIAGPAPRPGAHQSLLTREGGHGGKRVGA